MSDTTTTPIVYANSYFRRSATGILPAESPIATLQYSTSLYVNNSWEQVNDYLFQMKEVISENVLLYMNAILIGDLTTANGLAGVITDQIKDFCDNVKTVTGWNTVRGYMFNTESLVISGSNKVPSGTPIFPDNYEVGRTEIMVAQQDPTIVANVMRRSSTVPTLNYYAAISLGSFQENGQFPSLILKFAIVL